MTGKGAQCLQAVIVHLEKNIENVASMIRRGKRKKEEIKKKEEMMLREEKKRHLRATFVTIIQFGHKNKLRLQEY